MVSRSLVGFRLVTKQEPALVTDLDQAACARVQGDFTVPICQCDLDVYNKLHRRCINAEGTHTSLLIKDG